MTMVNGIGIDIVRVERIAEVFGKFGDKFACKILGSLEMIEYRKLSGAKEKIALLAKRFAAKEAVIKATGGRIRSFTDIQINHDNLGKPEVYLNKKYAGLQVLISITDEREFAAASAICIS